jgi:lipopolysaccharide transport system permease protein
VSIPEICETQAAASAAGLPTGAGDRREIARLVIRPTSGWRPVSLVELWRYRELLWFLALRDIKVRYKQTVLGVAWAVLQPLFTMIVFSVFFGALAGIGERVPANSAGQTIPYSVYVLCALLPWQLFAFALTSSSNSLVQYRGIITKVYFPRLIVPMAPLVCGLIDFAIALGLLALLMAWFGVVPGWQIVFFPGFVLLALASALAVGVWLSALNALYRDVQYTLPFLTQVWFFLTPVAYPSSLVPERWRWLYGLNPMAGVVEGFRWSLLDSGASPGPMMLVSIGTIALLLIGGLFGFRRMEKQFADLV